MKFEYIQQDKLIEVFFFEEMPKNNGLYEIIDCPGEDRCIIVIQGEPFLIKNTYISKMHDIKVPSIGASWGSLHFVLSNRKVTISN